MCDHVAESEKNYDYMKSKWLPLVPRKYEPATEITFILAAHQFTTAWKKEYHNKPTRCSSECDDFSNIWHKNCKEYTNRDNQGVYDHYCTHRLVNAKQGKNLGAKYVTYERKYGH